MINVNAILNIIGDKTQNQLQLITPTSFNTIKINVNVEAKPSPLVLPELLSMLIPQILPLY